jgi:hypothetical protein
VSIIKNRIRNEIDTYAEHRILKEYLEKNEKKGTSKNSGQTKDHMTDK